MASLAAARIAQDRGNSKARLALEPKAGLMDTTIRQTEKGDGLRLIQMYGDHIRLNESSGKWLIWTGAHWRESSTEIYQYGWNVAATLLDEASKLLKAGNHTEGRALSEYAIKLESNRRQEQMIKAASRMPGISISIDELDKDNDLLNVQNGTIDLRTFELRPHRPSDLLTKIVPVAYDKSATCPTWTRFLNQIMNNNEDVIEFLQRAVGYTLTGDVSEQALFFMHGHGKNGKSTFIEVLNALLGQEQYVRKLPSDSIMRKQQKGIPNDIATLPGCRLLFLSEIGGVMRLNEELVKDLTGKDTIPARFLNKEWFSFRPTHKLWMYGNHKPIIGENDEGIWRRVALIPFEVTIPVEERDLHFLEKLLAELPGILVWALEGCKAWRERGLDTPYDILNATADYRAEMDIIGTWIKERLVQKAGLKVPSAKLYEDYGVWCREAGELPQSQRRWGQELTSRGFTRKLMSGKTFYEGYGFLAQPT